MALKYPDILQSNNPNAYGIVPANEVSGHKQVANLKALYALADPILSLSGTNTSNDAIGQLWYVASEGKHYQLVDWANRKNINGWKVFKSGGGGGTIVFNGIITTEVTIETTTTTTNAPTDIYYYKPLSCFIAKDASGKYYHQWSENDAYGILSQEDFGLLEDGQIVPDWGRTYQNKADDSLWIYNSETGIGRPVTYLPQSLGFGFGICSTAAATAAKVATLTDYALIKNGIVSVKFTNSVPANSTLNINSKGAKPIFYRGAKIVAGVINAGDVATFIYDGTNYIYLGTDNALSKAGGKINGELIIADDTDDVVEIDAQGITLRDTSDDEQPQTKITHAKVESNVIKKVGGTSDQVLMADGSVAGTITTAWLEANLT